MARPNSPTDQALRNSRASDAEQRAPDRNRPCGDGPRRESVEIGELFLGELAHVGLDAQLRRGVVERADRIPQHGEDAHDPQVARGLDGWLAHDDSPFFRLDHHSSADGHYDVAARSTWITRMHRSTLARTRPLIAALLCCVAAQALALDAKEKRIVRAVDARQAQALGLLAETVDIDSATENHAGVRKVGDVLARELARLGFETRWVDVPAEVGRAGHLVAVHRGTKGQRLLLIGHLDTVLEGERFRRDGNRAYGSGTADMKGGNVIIVEALRALHAAGALRDRQVTVVFTGDEEDPGAPVELSREALLAAGEQSDIALGFEGGLPGSRRDRAAWHRHVAAAGHRPAGALVGHLPREPGLRRHLRGGADPRPVPRGTAGTEPHVQPVGDPRRHDRDLRRGEQGRHGARQDQRDPARSPCDGRPAVPVVGTIRRRPRENDGHRRREPARNERAISFEQEYPSMAPTDANLRVLAVLDAVSRDLGAGPVIAQDPAERGAGDISFVCSGRLACLDGLGAMGDDVHAPGEYAEVDTLLTQTQRAALLFYRLTR